MEVYQRKKPHLQHAVFGEGKTSQKKALFIVHFIFPFDLQYLQAKKTNKKTGQNFTKKKRFVFPKTLKGSIHWEELPRPRYNKELP